MPLYGAGFNPYFTAVDSTFTDESGNFSINLDEIKFGGADFAIVKIDTINNYNRFQSVSGELLDFESIQEPLILHMYPIVRTDIKDKLKPQSSSFFPTIYGNTFSIKIADWSSTEKYSAKIFNISGRVVASPIVLKDGIISWNIANVARGEYYMMMENGKKTVNTRITVK